MSIGLPQILIILLLVVIVFGVGKLPRVMGDLGKGMRNFKKGLNEEDETDTKIIDAKAKDSENTKTDA
tara:strand:+ start:1237 stop:1440 length:204 start_codon:yes stop_codon:yes gene_type:complete